MAIELSLKRNSGCLKKYSDRSSLPRFYGIWLGRGSYPSQGFVVREIQEEEAKEKADLLVEFYLKDRTSFERYANDILQKL